MKKIFLLPLAAVLLILSVAGRLICLLSGRLLGLALLLGTLPHLGAAMFGKLGDLAETVNEI